MTGRSASTIEFCIHCGDEDERTQNACWLCDDHWKLTVRVWGRNDDGTMVCPLCNLDDTPSAIEVGDADEHLLEAHDVETNFEFIRERERLLGVPSPGKRGVQVDAEDTYEDAMPQTELERWAA